MNVLRWLLGTLAALVAVADVAFAQQPQAMETSQYADGAAIPTSAVLGLGFKGTVRATPVGAAGYFPLQLTLTAAAGGSFPADRTLTMRITHDPQQTTPRRNAVVVDVPVTIRQGKKQVVARHMIPKYAWGSIVNVQLREAGSPLENCSTLIGALETGAEKSRAQSARFVLSSPPMLFIASSDQSAQPQSGVGPSVPLSEAAANGSDRSDLSLANLPIELQAMAIDRTVANQHSRIRHPRTWYRREADHLPWDWRFYQHVRGVLVDFETLRQIRAQHADRLNALRRYVMMGGTLIVVGIDSPEQVTESLGVGGPVDRNQPPALTDDIPRSPAKEVFADLRRPSIRSWQRLPGAMPKEFDQTVSESMAIQSSGQNTQPANRLPMGFGSTNVTVNGQVIQLDNEVLVRDKAGKVIPLPEDYLEQIDRWEANWKESKAVFAKAGKPFRMEVGAGMVLGILHDRGDYPIDNPHWQFVEAHLDGLTTMPLFRRGVEPYLGDHRFYNWLIAGVAQPPVYTFIGLLLGFVVTVGPLSFWWTTKTKRSHLMFAIAPVLAVLTTGLLLAYGVISDGFDTQGRVRQITFVDGTSGDAVTRTRTSYFAGIRPAEGLRFAGDAEVIPYQANLETSWMERIDEPAGNPGTIRVTPEEQVFDSSFLPSRDQRQFVTHRPLDHFGRLQLGDIANDTTDEDGSDTRTRSVQSELPIALEELIVRDREGQSWYTANLAAGGTAVATELKMPSKALGRLYQKERLINRATRSSTRRFGSRGRDLWNSDLMQDILWDRNQFNLSQVDNATSFHGAFEYYLQKRLLYTGDLTPGTFVALGGIQTDELAVPDVRLADSIHFVTGSLP